MTSLLPSILTYAGVGALILAFAWMISIIARRSGRAEAERDQAEANQAAAERIAHAVNDAPRDPAALADKLRRTGGL